MIDCKEKIKNLDLTKKTNKKLFSPNIIRKLSYTCIRFQELFSQSSTSQITKKQELALMNVYFFVNMRTKSF